MQNANWFTVLRRLGRTRWRLLFEAVVTLASASAALAIMPFRHAIRFGSVSLGSNRWIGTVEDCVWATEVAARRLPWRCLCIQQGLAAQRMLRARGFDARLHYGARQEPRSGKLDAHVWVTVGGRAVVGGKEANGFAEIAAYP